MQGYSVFWQRESSRCVYRVSRGVVCSGEAGSLGQAHATPPYHLLFLVQISTQLTPLLSVSWIPYTPLTIPPSSSCQLRPQLENPSSMIISPPGPTSISGHTWYVRVWMVLYLDPPNSRSWSASATHPGPHPPAARVQV